VLVSGAALAQLIIVVSSPVFTRIYSPDDFGVFAVFLPLVAIGSVGGALRYEHAIVLPEDDRDGAAILILTFFLTVATAALAAVALVLFGEDLTTATNVPDLQPLLWLVPVALVAAGVYQSFVYWGIRTAAFPRIARSRIWQAGSQSASTVGLGVAGWQPAGLLVGAVVGSVGASVELAHRLWKHDRPAVRGVQLADMRRLAHRYRRFPQLGLWAGFLNVAVLELPSVLVAGLFGASTAGLFLLARRVIAAPVMAVSQSVHQVYLNEAAEVIRTDPRRLQALYRRTWQRLLVLAIGPAVVAALVAPFVFELVFGEEWREAGIYVSILTPMLLAQLTTSPLAATFAIAERQDLELVRDAIRLGLVLAAFGVAAMADLSPRWTVLIYGLASAAGYLLLFAFGTREVNRVRDDALAALERDGKESIPAFDESSEGDLM
jgi:O-antigen/teichoic acid export membrane protein